ncbi:hypothetical protein COL79_18715, partial [Bacillus pseudomycoides]
IPILAWVSGFTFITELVKKLYKISHALSVIFFRNAGDTPLRNSAFMFCFRSDSKVQEKKVNEE